jgi:hypothetical protein
VLQCRHKAPPISDLQRNTSLFCCIGGAPYLLRREPAGFLAQDGHSRIHRLGDQLNMKSAGSRHDDAVEAPGTQHGAKIGMNRNFWSG